MYTHRRPFDPPAGTDAIAWVYLDKANRPVNVMAPGIYANTGRSILEEALFRLGEEPAQWAPTAHTGDTENTNLVLELLDDDFNFTIADLLLTNRNKKLAEEFERKLEVMIEDPLRPK